MTASALFFSESGNNLVIAVAGTTSEVTVKNWFADCYAQLALLLSSARPLYFPFEHRDGGWGDG